MNFWRTLGHALPDLAQTAAGLGAVASIAYGAWQVYAPAGWIVGGSLVLVGVCLGARGQ